MSEPHARSFDTAQEAFDWIREQGERASAVLVPEQKQINRGDYWVRFEPVGEGVLTWFGHAYELGEFKQIEYDAGCDDDEWNTSTLPALLDAEERDYLYSEYFSITEPEGESRSVHRVYMWPINEAVFADAREARWDLAGMHPASYNQVDAAWQRYYRFARDTEGQW